jgi:hypothetical protein
MPQADTIFALFPAVKNVRHTPFEEHDATRLIYSPGLIKTVFARRYYRNDSWSKIARDLKLDIEQVKRAFARGRTLKINPSWIDAAPEIQYEQVHIEKPKARTYNLKGPKSPHRSWGDEIVGWVLAQHELMGRSTAELHRSLERFYPISGAPSLTLIYKWVMRDSKQAAGLKVTPELLELFPFYETEARPAGRPSLPVTKVKPLTEAQLRRQRSDAARAIGRAFLEQQEKA